MHRRTFLATAAAAAAAATSVVSPALAASGTPYKPGLVDSELKAGKTVFVDFDKRNTIIMVEQLFPHKIALRKQD